MNSRLGRLQSGCNVYVAMAPRGGFDDSVIAINEKGF